MKTIFRTIGEGTMWMTAGTFFTKISGIAYAVVVLSNLSVFEYGLAELAMSIPPLLGFLSLTGLDAVLIADLVSLKSRGEKEEGGRLLLSYVWLKSILGLFGFMLLLVTPLFFMETFSGEVRAMVAFLAGIFLLSPLRSLIVVTWNVRHDFRKISFFNILLELSKFSGVVIFLVIFDFGPLGLIMSYMISEFLITIIFAKQAFGLREYFTFKEKYQNPFYVLKNHAKWGVLRVSLHSFTQNIRPWMIQFFLGIQAVGIYSLAMSMLQHLSSLFPLSQVVSPIFPAYLDEPKKIKKIINSSIKYQLLIMLVTSTVVILSLPFLLIVLFPSYSDSYPLFVLLAFGLIPSSFNRIYDSVFHALKLQRNLFFSNMFANFLTLIITPTALYFVGINGIAVEFFITLSSYALGRYLVLRKNLDGYDFDLRDLFRFTYADKVIWQKLKVALFRFKKAKTSI